MGKRKDLSDFDKGQIRAIFITASPKGQVLWGVPGTQWSVPTKSGPRKDNWGTGDRVMGTQGAKANPSGPIPQKS